MVKSVFSARRGKNRWEPNSADARRLPASEAHSEERTCASSKLDCQTWLIISRLNDEFPEAAVFLLFVTLFC